MSFSRLIRRRIEWWSHLALTLGLLLGILLTSEASSATLPPTQPEIQDCYIVVDAPGFKSCTYQFLAAKPNYRVALIGDSHLRGLYPAITTLASKFNWSLTALSKSACPWVDSKLFPLGLERGYCKDWNISREAYLASQPHFDLIITSQSSFVTHSFQNIGKGFASAVKRQTKRGSWVLLIRDVPKGMTDTQLCLSDASKAAVGGCDNSRVAALAVIDPMPAAVLGWRQVIRLDLTNAFCSATKCPAIVAGQAVYKDAGHITPETAIRLMPIIEKSVPAKFKKPKS